MELVEDIKELKKLLDWDLNTYFRTFPEPVLRNATKELETHHKTKIELANNLISWIEVKETEKVITGEKI